MSIYIGEPVIISDMQGPCAAGFHIPTNTEWQDVLNIFIGFGIGYSNYKIYLKLPLGGYRSYTDGELYSTGDAGRYWSSVEYESGYIYCLNATDSTTEVDWHYRLAGYGCSIRPFKDKPSVPDPTRTTIYQGGGNAGVYHNSNLGLISISSDGTTWITIADKNLGATTVWNNGDTLSESNCGKYYQRGNNYGFDGIGGSNPTASSTQVNAGSYGPGNYYSSSTFITGNSGIPYTGTYSNLRGGVSQGSGTKSVEVQNIYIGEYKGYTQGIYHNSTDGLISFSSDGTTWYTIADKNVGASTVYNNGDTLSASNCGYYYQWGNNYGFAWDGNISLSITQVDASNYGPTNPYSSSTFIYYNIGSGRNWDSSNNMNLWGDITDTLEARKGPCDIGFHVPTDSDLTILCDTLTTISGEQIGDTLKKYALMPMNGYRNGYSSSGEISLRNVFGYYWSSSTESFSYGTYPYLMYFYSTDKSIMDTPTSMGANVRPFKNEPVIPNSSWTKLK